MSLTVSANIRLTQNGDQEKSLFNKLSQHRLYEPFLVPLILHFLNQQELLYALVLLRNEVPNLFDERSGALRFSALLNERLACFGFANYCHIKHSCLSDKTLSSLKKINLSAYQSKTFGEEDEKDQGLSEEEHLYEGSFTPGLSEAFSPLTDDEFSHIGSKCHSLREINLDNCSSLTTIQPLTQFDSLTSLSLFSNSSLKQTAEMSCPFAPLSSLKNLKNLQLRNNHELVYLSWIQGLVNLEKLSLSFCPNIPAQEFCHLESLTGLTWLALSRAEHLRDLSFLTKMPRLKELSLRECSNLSNESLQKLACSVNLTWLSVRSCSLLRTTSFLFSLALLEELELGYCPEIELNELLRDLPYLQSLKRLDLSYYPYITIDLCHVIASLPSLENLSFFRLPPLERSFLQPLQQSNRLQRILVHSKSYAVVKKVFSKCNRHVVVLTENNDSSKQAVKKSCILM